MRVLFHTIHYTTHSLYHPSIPIAMALLRVSWPEGSLVATLPINEHHRLFVLANINRAYLSKWNHDQICQHFPLPDPSTLHPEANCHTAVIDGRGPVRATFYNSGVTLCTYHECMEDLLCELYCSAIEDGDINRNLQVEYEQGLYTQAQDIQLRRALREHGSLT